MKCLASRCSVFVGMIFVLVMTGCGYRLQRCCSSAQKTLAVPFIDQDEGGELTSQLIGAIASRGHWQIVTEDYGHVLQVRLMEKRESDVDFRPAASGLVPVQRRVVLVAEVSLLRSDSNAVVFGPIEVEAEVEYDYEESPAPSLMKESLGQLGPLQSMQDVGLSRAYAALAQKIAHLLLTEKTGER